MKTKFIRRVVVNKNMKYKIQYTSSIKFIRFLLGWIDYIGTYDTKESAGEWMKYLQDIDGEYIPV